MRKLLTLLFLPTVLSAQVVGSTKTEQYRATFEQKSDWSALMDYDGKTIPIQILSLGIGEEVYAMYPELKDNRVGLGVTNIVIEFLEETNRFTFTEDKTEIKNRMVKQFQASQSGITENKLDGRGKIVLAKYFVYIEVYDYSVSEDETINMKDGVKNTVVTRLGLQVRFVDAETGQFFTGSGLGEAKTVRELTLMNDDNFGEVKFNQSTIGTSTKKALEDAAAKIVTRMIRRGIFPN
jgi:hypothetical protein